MSILNRFSDVVRSNINALIDRAEDPEKMANQIILDLEKIRSDVTTQVASAIADEKRLKSMVEQNLAETERWEKRAMDALAAEDEELAREAIIQKQKYETSLNSYTEQHTRQLTQVESLKQNLKDLNEKVYEAQRRRDDLIARSKIAKTQAKINQAVNTTSSANPMNALDRMEQKVQKKEAMTEAYTELNQEQNIEKKFVSMEKDRKVEDELAALRAKMAKDKSE